MTVVHVANSRLLRRAAQRGKAKRTGEQDSISSITAQWQREWPKLDARPMALFGALARAYLLTSPAIERLMAKHGLTRGMFDVLAALRRSGHSYGLPPSKLSKSLMLSGGGMTNRLDRLERLGLIARMPEPSDRRCVQIQLTPKGGRVVEKIAPQLVGLEKQLVAEFGQTNVRKLTHMLIAFSQTLGKDASR